tara:strand:+ start:251 stop:688 length:438 start_codon:yes stop_codon:yes gene_type:complete
MANEIQSNPKFQNLLELIRLQKRFSGEFPEPQIPDQAIAGLTPEQHEMMLAGLKRSIGEGTTKSLRSLRSSAASRGLGRSGLLQKLESETLAGGQTNYADALARIYSDRSGAFQRFNLNRYNIESQRRGQNLAGIGKILGRIARV